MKTRMLIVSILFAGAAGCSQEAPQASAADSGMTAKPVAAVPAPRQEQPGTGGAVLSLSPSAFPSCDTEEKAITATAAWDATGRGISEVSIYVTKAKGERKLWLDGGAKGVSTTGKWVFPGSKFELVARGSDTVLAEHTVEATPCG